MDLVSVIVPVYNVEKYLDRCVESIINQTYKSIEIILVDDGSTDQSPRMCDEWMNKDNRVKVIHKINGGLSSARNAGLEIMCGEYVCFIDSDDYIEPNMIDLMLDSIKKDDFELCICNMKYVDENSNVIGRESTKPIMLYGNDIIVAFLENKYFNSYSACNKLYKTSVINENAMCFDESIKWGEDWPFNYLYFKRISKLISIERSLYNYLKKRDGSITVKINSGQVNRWKNYGIILQNEVANPETYNVALTQYARLLLCCCRELLRSNDKKLIGECYAPIVEEIKKYYSEFRSLKDLSMKVWMSIKMIYINPSAYKMIYLLYNKLK